MHSGERKHGGNGILRAVFVGLSLLLQIGWLLLIVLELNKYSTGISLLTSVIASVVVLRLYSRNTNSAYKMPWIMLIMALPVMGLSLYLMAEILGSSKWVRNRVEYARQSTAKHLKQEEAVMSMLENRDISTANQFRYLWQGMHYPVYRGTDVQYHDFAVRGFARLKEDLETAERFIFLEYFIVEDDRAFREILDILVRKAAQGVEVRLMYDDVGSIGYVNLKFARRISQMGIQCRAFNPALPVLNLFINHRDHRKITVIDGKIGFTGGYNLANEYFGYSQPYGVWKDTGIRLEGEAVRSLTATFLELWNVMSREKEDFAKYLDISHSVSGGGFVQPFGDDPLGDERTAENVYLNLIANSKRYIWFITPYLMITDEMNRTLGLAARRGVDVRIITPGIPDKKTVYQLTRSYYAGLVRQGVRIFEYSPGFCHAKQCLCDGETATIGTSNLDYRSLYLHFENDVLLYDCPAVKDMEEDFRQTFAQCQEVTEKYRTGRPAMLRLWQCILRLFAPMM